LGFVFSIHSEFAVAAIANAKLTMNKAKNTLSGFRLCSQAFYSWRSKFTGQKLNAFVTTIASVLRHKLHSMFLAVPEFALDDLFRIQTANRITIKDFSIFQLGEVYCLQREFKASTYGTLYNRFVAFCQVHLK